MKLKLIAAIAVLLLVVASLLVAGCTTGNPSSTSNPTDVQGKVNSPQATAVPTANNDAQIRLSATQATVPQQIGTYTPKAGYKFVAFNVTIKNIAAPKYYTNAYDWQLRDTAGGVYKPATPTYSSEIEGLDGTNTIPGDVVSGLIVYEVPQNATLKSITWSGGLNNVILNI
jgi:Domain of unknown function (DUF4352)